MFPSRLLGPYNMTSKMTVVLVKINQDAGLEAQGILAYHSGKHLCILGKCLKMKFDYKVLPFVFLL